MTAASADVDIQQILEAAASVISSPESVLCTHRRRLRQAAGVRSRQTEPTAAAAERGWRNASRGLGP